MKRQTESDLISLILQMIISIAAIMLTSLLCIRLCRKSNPLQLRLDYKIIVVNGMIFNSFSIIIRIFAYLFVSCHITYAPQMSDRDIYNDPSSATYESISNIKSACSNATTDDIVNVSMSISIGVATTTFFGYIFIYCSYWLRLEFTFKDTIWKMTNNHKRICILFLILMIIIGIMIDISIILIDNIAFVHVFMFSGLAVYAIGSTFVCYLMLKQMNLFITSKYIDHDSTSSVSFTNVNVGSQSQSQIKRDIYKSSTSIDCKIHLMIRLATLALVTLVSTVILNIVLFLEASISDQVRSYYWLQQSVDTFANMACLMLQFNFLTTMYQKCCCLCHNCLMYKYQKRRNQQQSVHAES